ncbi:sickle tail protein isoform X2 [Oryzias latipes]|nr:sickle tail protein isoform X2 [Oryzias latipes]
MWDGEAPGPFRRGCQTRASLPAGHWSSHQAERPLGVLYLQYGQETLQVKMPAEISCLDSVHALFATAFPYLTMKMLQSPNMGICIKDINCNAYYDMNDIRDIKPYSCLKAYHKDPRQVFHPCSRFDDGKISKEVLYGNHGQLNNQSCSTLTSSILQGSMSPPVVRSMPSSPSRRTYGGRGTGGRRGTSQSGSSTLPRESFSRGGQSSTSCSSVILERRDVMPDNQLSNKSRALLLCGDGGVPYPESCPSMDRTGRGHLSMTSSQCGAPPADSVDVSVRGIPGGLPQYRASIKPLMDHADYQSLHRQKCRGYGDSHLPPLGGRTPPMSPHRTNELRMMEEQMCGGWGLMSAEMSPIPCFLQRESDFATADIMSRSRGSSSSASSVFVDSPQGLPTSLGTTSSAYSEKISAMERQIASLAGLVHQALSMGSDVAPGFDERLESVSNGKSEARFTVDCDLAEENLNNNILAASVTNPDLNPLALVAHLPGNGLWRGLMEAQKQISELRLQLGKLRSTQLSNMDTIKSMLMIARQELVVLMFDRLTRLERVRNQRRALVEEDRLHYLTNEERLLTQLCELERYVQRLQSSGSYPGQPAVTLSDVEKAAVSLRELGEALASLKNEFPELQRKLQSALTLEVEAVRFLKEEPQKMDSMLKRVRALTETLSCMRRQVSGSSRSARADPLKQGPPTIHSPHSSPTLQPRCSVKVPPFSVNLTSSASPATARRMSTEATHHDHNTSFTPNLRPDSSAAMQAPPGNIQEQSDNLKRNG